MRKSMILLFVAFSLLYSSTLFAYECMSGDCNDGFGTGFTVDNKVYEGEWKDGVPNGHGKKYLSKGNVIEGTWENGKLVKEEPADKKDSGPKENNMKEK